MTRGALTHALPMCWVSKVLRCSRTLFPLPSPPLPPPKQVEALSLMRCPHVVPLLGYSTDGVSAVLAYEFVPNGSLHDHLHGTYCSVWWCAVLCCPHVLPLLGYSMVEVSAVLAYEFVPNGSLHGHLHGVRRFAVHPGCYTQWHLCVLPPYCGCCQCCSAVLAYEFVPNGSLHDHLHGTHCVVRRGTHWVGCTVLCFPGASCKAATLPNADRCAIVSAPSPIPPLRPMICVASAGRLVWAQWVKITVALARVLQSRHLCLVPVSGLPSRDPAHVSSAPPPLHPMAGSGRLGWAHRVEITMAVARGLRSLHQSLVPTRWTLGTSAGLGTLKKLHPSHAPPSLRPSVPLPVHPMAGSGRLDWAHRVKIAVAVARGLQSLHQRLVPIGPASPLSHPHEATASRDPSHVQHPGAATGQSASSTSPYTTNPDYSSNPTACLNPTNASSDSLQTGVNGTSSANGGSGAYASPHSSLPSSLSGSPHKLDTLQESPLEGEGEGEGEGYGEGEEEFLVSVSQRDGLSDSDSYSSSGEFESGMGSGVGGVGMDGDEGEGDGGGGKEEVVVRDGRRWVRAVHANLKSANVLLDNSGNAKVSC
ncbi:unnamed protein product [Closterium sp. NIES-54]